MPNMGALHDALFTKTQQRVLAVLFGRPERSFYANEIIGLAQSGSGAVQRELARLEAAGLITAHRVGNQKHYQTNPSSPIFSELRGIVLKTFGLSDVIRAALQPVWPALQVAFIYGSLAKGNDHAGSDIDLMLVATGISHRDVLEATAATHIELGRPVHPTLYSPDEFAQRRDEGASFITRVLAQPKIFIKGAEDELAGVGSAGQPGPHRQTQG